MLAALVGTPYALGGSTREGADCWGLVVLFYRERGIELPPYNAELRDAGKIEGYRRLRDGFSPDRIEGEIARAWVKVPRSEAQAEDVVVLANRQPQDHFALVVCRRWLLTTSAGMGAYLSRWSDWEGKVCGIYRFCGP